jgi:hypothetical protein
LQGVDSASGLVEAYADTNAGIDKIVYVAGYNYANASGTVNDSIGQAGL